MNLVFLAPFAFSPKATVSARMLPIASALAHRGHLVTLLVPPYDNPADSQKRWDYQGVQIENMRLPHAAGPIQQLALAWQMARSVRQLQPNAIHVFKPTGPGALAMWLLHLCGERRFVVDNDDWEGRGGWLDVNPYPTLQKRVLAWQEVWCLRHARAITCASDALRERTQSLTRNNSPTVNDHLPIVNDRLPIVTAPNGPGYNLREQVARAEVQRTALRARFGWTGVPVAIYSGTVPFGHDMDIAVSAVRDALIDHPRLRWVIVATGDGLPSLQTAVRLAGLASAVEFHGFMAHEKLVEYLVAADVALYPYRDSNINRAKCSGKVIDYMACAKPMVVSDVGMNRVYVEHGRSGLLTPPGDAPAFSAALRALLVDAAGADRMGRSAQERIWERFGWEDRIGEVEALYARASLPPGSAPAS